MRKDIGQATVVNHRFTKKLLLVLGRNALKNKQAGSADKLSDVKVLVAVLMLLQSIAVLLHDC